MAVGQISGPLLKSNLLRNGVDLAFDTDLLYLEVNDRRVGIKTTAPTHELTVNGTTKTTNLIVDNQLKVGDDTQNIVVTNNSITSTNGAINILPAGAGAVVYNGTVNIGSMSISDNTITTATDTDLTLDPSGTGKVNVNSNLEIFGDLHITGIITATGTINSENVTLAGGIDGNLLPAVTDFYDIGRSDKRWQDAWINNINADTIITTSLTVGGVDLNVRPSNTIYVSTNGDNANTGTHPQDPYGSIKYALSVATAGTTILIYPGTYTEIFPMTIPAGVTVKGAGIRSTIVKPTLGSNNKDAFLLNGETTIEDLSIADFFYEINNNTGYAFKFSAGMVVTSKSPYIRNVSVITKGSVTGLTDPLGFNQGDAGRGAYLDGSVVSSSSKEATGLFHSVTFITPGVDCVILTNGVRVEWLNCFVYYANRGMYAITGTTGFASNGKTTIRVSGQAGTFTAGQTLTSYASNGITVLAQGVINSVDGTKISLTGKVPGFVSKVDAAGKTATLFGSAQLSTTIKKFGTASLKLNGTTDYITYPSNADFAFGTGNFTLEAFAYLSSISTEAILYDFRTTTSQAVPALGVSSSGAPYYYVNGAIVIQGTAGTVTTGVQHHIAVSRVSGVTRLFLNGQLVGTPWTDSTNYISSSLTIGSNFGHTSFVDGYLDEMRVSKGIGKYNTNFSVTTSEFVKSADTVLLLHFNGTDGSTVIEDDSFIVQDIRTATGSALYIETTDYTDFGAEVRVMSSANVYGNYGVVGDGEGIVMYLIGHNFAYIGSGKDSSNDTGNVIQTNEVVETNNAHIYYSSVDQRGDFRVGDLFYVNQETGQVQFTTANFNIDSATGITLSDGTNTTIIDGTKIETGDIRISGNTIETLTTDLNIVSAGDQINLLNNVSITGNLDVGGNIVVGGNIQIGDQPTDTVNIVAGIVSDLIPSGNFNLGSTTNRWAEVYTNNLVIDTVQINGSTVQSVSTNSPLTLAAGGVGFIKFENYEVQDNELRTSNNDNLVLKPNGTGIVYIDSTQSLRLPSGTSDQRGVQTGGIRYNTQTSHFEGYNGSNWVILDGVYDTDLNTYITAELTPGANDNVIRFYSNGSLVADINSTRLRAEQIQVGSIVINNNTISASTPNTNISLTTTGTGAVNVENFAFKDSTVTAAPNTILTFQQTGDGYFKFTGTSGLVIPFGLSSERPLIAELGMVRYNTSDKRLEVYNGSTWINSAGESTANVTVGEAEELSIQFILTLG